jgi:hypothetical protein
MPVANLKYRNARQREGGWSWSCDWVYSLVHDQLPPPLWRALQNFKFAWLPPTVHSNCSELHARTFLVALENHLGWLGESNRSNLELASTYASSSSLFCLPSATLSLQWLMKFGNIVRVETSRYLTKITTLRSRRFLQPSIRLRYNYYVRLVAIRRGRMRLKFWSACQRGESEARPVLPKAPSVLAKALKPRLVLIF